MLVMKVGDLDQPVPTPHSPTSKGQRWGSIRQRLSSISNKDGIDDAMWDKVRSFPYLADSCLLLLIFKLPPPPDLRRMTLPS